MTFGGTFTERLVFTRVSGEANNGSQPDYAGEGACFLREHVVGLVATDDRIRLDREGGRFRIWSMRQLSG